MYQAALFIMIVGEALDSVRDCENIVGRRRHMFAHEAIDKQVCDLGAALVRSVFRDDVAIELFLVRNNPLGLTRSETLQLIEYLHAFPLVEF